MTKDQLQSFLNDSGVAFSQSQADSDTIEFKNRGTSLQAIGYAQGDLLHLTCTYKMPTTSTSAAKVHEVFQAAEDQFPIVKLRAAGSEEEPTFVVSAEQFEPDLGSIGKVFWRTADLLVVAADECYRRFASQEAPAREAPAPEVPAQETPAPETPAVENQTDSLSQYIAKLEETLRKACSRPDAGTSATDDDDAGVYARVKTSLAFVITKDGSTGSAFCVASGATASYYVTSAHLTRGSATVTLYRQKPRYEKMEATVAAEGDGAAIDLAMLCVDSPNVPPLELAEKTPKDESQVALAGYARVQLWAAQQFGELIPSIHFGTVTGVLNSGTLVLHDVICRPGDSGGPLFDPRSGDVVGVQKGGWQEDEEGYAIGAPVLASFLKANKVAT